MTKKTFLALLLSLLVMIGYNYFMGQRYPQQPVEPIPVLQEDEEKSAVAVPSEQEKDFAVRMVERSKDILVETDLFKIIITSSGARIKSCELKQYAEEKLNLELVKKELTKVRQRIEQAAPDQKKLLLREKDKYTLLLKRLQEDGKKAQLVSLPAELDAELAPTILFKNDKNVTQVLNTRAYQCLQDNLRLDKMTPEGYLLFIYVDSHRRKIKKRYSFSNSSYAIGLDISFEGWEQKELSSDKMEVYLGPGIGVPQIQRGRRGMAYQGPISCFLNSHGQSYVEKETYNRKETQELVRREHKKEYEHAGKQVQRKILWAGLENKYFLSALIPSQTADSIIVEKNKFGEQKIALSLPWEGSQTYNFKFYLGPKQKNILGKLGASLEKSIDYGFFGPIGRLLYQVLVFFFRWTHNFGWAIILLGLLIKMIFYPFTHRSFESMQKIQQQMKSIQPEVDELRERLKNNPQKMNKEMLELYRRKGVNPLAGCQSGCLPLLFQMPVFFALYAVLYNAIELRGAPFIGWIQDLSAKDPYYILPILMGISMFVQQKLSGMSSASAAQQQQAKMMNVMMSLMFTWIFANFPSGIVLYWLTFNIITAGQQLIIKRQMV